VDKFLPGPVKGGKKREFRQKSKKVEKDRKGINVKGRKEDSKKKDGKEENTKGKKGWHLSEKRKALTSGKKKMGILTIWARDFGKGTTS